MTKETKQYGIDIHVPTHGKLELTIPCVDHIYAHTQTPFHLIVTDTDPEGEEGLTELYFKRLMQNRNNVTYIKAENFKTGNTFFNTALRHTKTEFMATVMNSVWVEPEWEMVALQLMNEQKDVGTIGFKAIFAPEHPQFGRIESAGIAFQGHIPVDIGRGEPAHRLNSVYECQAVQWAFALHRKVALIGNLDENTFNGHVGWDDIDNCFVVKSKGWRILYCGLGCGYHHPRATRGDDSEEAAKKNRENSHIFFKRWGYWDAYCQANNLNAKGEPKVYNHKSKKRGKR